MPPETWIAAKAGRELGVGTVVVGRFLRHDKTVKVTLEAVEVKDNRLIWTGELSSAADNLIALQTQMAKKVRQELVPVLGIAPGAVETSSIPGNRDAYETYMRSKALSHDGEANQAAIAMLLRSVALDPNYAPAWEALGRRYYYDAIYSGGGAAGYQRSNAGLPASAFAGTGTGGCGRIPGDQRGRGGKPGQSLQ